MSDRTLILHHDDLGASRSANRAFVELSDKGVVTSGSVMVPCPWFADLAQIARDRPDLDIGVHLTLTSEFPRCRWRPMTGAKGLMDTSGHFPTTSEEAATRDPALVRAELIAQIDAAYDAGIDVTHLDTHMLVMAFPSLLPVYLELGDRYDLPIVLTRDATRFLPPGSDLTEAFRILDQRGIPPIGKFLHTPFGNLSPTPETYAQILDQAQPGLTFCAFHFTAPGDAEWMSDDAPTRLAEYRIFASGWANDFLADHGFRLSGMRAIRDRMRAA
ncbi:polysaccharide deacetylase family protein [Tabrizicola sp.]|uniref:polysaccharide deacetylase family protein n=1 Tax=Tabrizicola sp. TaxID=2005166 RepID=UPI0035AF0315